MLLICLSIAIEVALIESLNFWRDKESILIKVPRNCSLFVKLICDSLEAIESFDWLLVKVLVLEFWLQEDVLDLFLGHFLLVHLHLLLLLLDARVDAVDKNVFVDDVR